jgi:UDP-N-acetylmuramyl pentapeptide phosphotransferase/UDP-N-acetylglucosamine-1-phosphate transferase
VLLLLLLLLLLYGIILFFDDIIKYAYYTRSFSMGSCAVPESIPVSN